MRLAIAIWRRRWVILAAAIASSMVGVAVAKTLVPTIYETRGVIECDRCSEIGFGDRELATLQESVKLPQHLEKVRQTLGLEATIETLERDIDVNASLESRLIQITARGKRGDQAAGMVNIILDAFMETRLSVEQDKLQQRARKCAGDLEKARAVIADARMRYDRFRRDNDISDLPAERLAAIEQAAKLRSELAIARGEEEAEQARIESLQNAANTESATTVLNRTEEMPNARRLVEKRTDLKSAHARLSDDHPTVRSLRAEVETLEENAAMDNAPVTVTQVIGRNPNWDAARQGLLQANANQRAASTRQLAYAKLAQEAADAATRLSQIEGQGATLLSNLQTAEHHLTGLEIASRNAEDAARAPSSGLRILATARAPSVPAKSPRRIVAILGPFIGSCIAVMALLLYELRGLRVYTATELAHWCNAPVLMTSPWPRKTNALAGIITELVSSLRRAPGKTIIVGLGAAELAPAHALAYGLQSALESESLDMTNDFSAIEAFGSTDDRVELRCAARSAERIIVVVSSGAYSAIKLRTFIHDLARPGRVGFVLINSRPEHASLPDKMGNDDVFWNSRA